MPDPDDLRIHVTWGPNARRNTVVRASLLTMGLREVSRDETASLFAAAPPVVAAPEEAAETAPGRRVTVRG